MSRKTPLPSPIDLRVVGLTFQPGYPITVWELEERLPRRAKLVREPDNQYDENAIAVLVGSVKLGHLDRNTAARLAPELDKGVRWVAHAVRVETHPEHPDRPGVWLHAVRSG